MGACISLMLLRDVAIALRTSSMQRAIRSRVISCIPGRSSLPINLCAMNDPVNAPLWTECITYVAWVVPDAGLAGGMWREVLIPAGTRSTSFGLGLASARAGLELEEVRTLDKSRCLDTVLGSSLGLLTRCASGREA